METEIIKDLYIMMPGKMENDLPKVIKTDIEIIRNIGKDNKYAIARYTRDNCIYEFTYYYNNYEYYFGVVKGNCYGHGTTYVINELIESGTIVKNAHDVTLKAIKYYSESVESVNSASYEPSLLAPLFPPISAPPAAL